MAKTISDSDRMRASNFGGRQGRGGPPGRTISDADRRLMELLLGEGSRNVSDADRARVNELLREMKRKDGGMARKTRVF
jgi:hypothetical protein